MNADQIGLPGRRLLPYGVAGGSKMEVVPEGGKGAQILVCIIRPQITEVFRQRDGSPAAAVMAIQDLDLHVGQVPSRGRLEHAESQGLKPDLGVVEILDGGLDEKNFHESANLSDY